MNAAPLPSDPTGLRLLDDPLADWPNDDLLFEQKQRDYIARRHPKVAPILDWPQLRDLFAAHDPKAGRFRRTSRRLGILAAACGCAALLVAALTPLTLELMGDEAAGDLARQIMGGLAALLGLASGVLGYSGVLSGGAKWRWLAHRFWTERMRQLHFQTIVNNLPLAVAAMSDPAALGQWRKLRADILDGFVHRFMEPLSESLQRLRDDLAEDRPWLEEAWAAAGPVPGPSADLAELFEVLDHQRFGIQKRYTRFKLRPGIHSPRARSRALRGAADTMTMIVLLLCVIVGLMFLFQADPDSAGLLAALTLSGCLSAFVLTLRVLEEGLQLREETERYQWYLAAVEALQRRYRTGDDEAKIAVLRDMERLSYQELRRFTVSFSQARFVM